MPIIYKYLIREILKYLTIILIMVIGIYLSVDFFEKIDDFMEAGLSFSRVLSFFLYKIPFIIAQVIPVGFLLSVLVVFGIMNKNNEMIAMRSSGVSVYYLLRPMFAVGLLLSIFLFFLSETLVPLTVGRANNIWLREVRKEAAVLSKEKNIWIKGIRTMTHIKYYNSEKQTIYGITLTFFDDNFRLVRRVDAHKGIFTKAHWVLYDIMEQRFTPKYSVKLFRQQKEEFEFLPANLKRVAKKSEEMNFKELLAYIKRIESEGYDATIQRVDLHAKFAFPFVCLIFSLVGTGIAIRGKLKEGLPASIAYGLGIAFLYWVFYSLCVSLGRGEMIPALPAVWIANFIFFCFGVLTLLNAE